MSEHNNNNNNKRRADAAPAPTKTPEPEYKVGPGRPPKEHQFKPGQSGNPKGLKRKPKPMAPDLKAALERALHETIKLKQGERERTMTSNWLPSLSKVTIRPGAIYLSTPRTSASI
jgi:hypothetical protein